MRACLFALAVAASGCVPTTAIVDGKAAARLDLQFTGDKASHLDVRDAAGARAISGQLGNAAVDLTLTGTALTGHVGLRVFALEQEGDRLVGALRLSGWARYDKSGPVVVRAILDGRDALWGLPPADQALVLATVLTCQMHQADPHAGAPDDLVLRFGGPAVERPAETSSLYRRGH